MSKLCKHFINTNILSHITGKTIWLFHSLTRSILFSRTPPFRRDAVVLSFTHPKWNTGDYIAEEITISPQMRDLQV